MAGKKVIMDELIEKQTESLKKIEQYTSIMRLADIASAIEEKRILDDENSLLEETKIIRTSIDSILEHVVELKDKLLKSLPTQEDKNEQLTLQNKQLEALEKLSEGQQARQDLKEGMGLGKVVAGIAIALGALAGTVSAYVKNIKFWLDVLKSGGSNFAELISKIIPENVKEFGSKLKKDLLIIIRRITDPIIEFGSKIKESFLGALKRITDPIEVFVSKIKQFFTIKEDGAISKIIKAFRSGFESFKTGLTKFIEPFTDAFKFISEFFSGPTVKAAEESKGIFTVISENLGKFGKMFNAVSKIVGKLLLPLNIIMTAWDVVKGAMEGYEKEGIVGAIEGAVTGLFNSVIGGMLDLLKNGTSWVLEKLGFNEASAALDSFSFEDLISDFIDAIMHPIDTIQQIINGLMVSITEGVNGIINKVNSVLPDSFKIPTLDAPEKRVSEREGKRPSEVNAVKKSGDQLTHEEKQKYYEVYSKKISAGASHGESVDAMEDARIADIKAKPESSRTDDEKRQIQAYDYFKNKKAAEAVKPTTAEAVSNTAEAVKPTTAEAVSNTAEAVKPTTAEAVSMKTTEAQEAQEARQTSAGNTVVSAPTINNTSKTIQNQSIRLPVRTIENTINRYVTSRYAVQ